METLAASKASVTADDDVVDITLKVSGVGVGAGIEIRVGLGAGIGVGPGAGVGVRVGLDGRPLGACPSTDLVHDNP